MSEISLALNELFYGSGAWLGLLLFLAIILMISLKTKYAGLLMVPVTIFLGINYLEYPTLMWHAIIMFIASAFVVLNIFHDKD